MTEKELIERAQRLPFAGIISDDNRLDDAYMRNIVNAAANQLKKDVFQKNKRLNPQCYQKYWPMYQEDLQDDTCDVKFLCPNVISLDDQNDGFRYIGNIDGSIAFSRIKNRSELSTINNHRVMRALKNLNTAALYDSSAGVMETYGDLELEEMLIEALFSDPRSIPTYNFMIDQYPLNDDLIPMLDEYILKAVTAREAATAPDYRNQGNQQAGVK